MSIVTLGLGAGAATAVFTVVDAVVLEPLPFRAPHELVSIWETNLERGVSPQLGGGFPQEPALFNRTRLCVISDRLWRQQYGADPSIVGKTLEANGVYAIAGVMPAGFSFPGDVDLWLRL